MDWQTRRKFLYTVSFVFVILAASIFLLRDILFPKPTCSDKKQNGFEIGVDCGGTCNLRCSSEVAPLTTLWTRFIKTGENRYDLVAMVSNKNINNAAESVKYTFTVYGEDGSVIKEFSGITATPVNGDFPIMMLSVELLKRPSSVLINFIDKPHYTVRERTESPSVSVGQERYEEGDPFRVYVSVKNNKRKTIEKLPVKVLLYDEYNNVYAVGATVIESLGKEEVKTASFVWNKPYFSAPPTRIRAYPILNPFLTQE